MNGSRAILIKTLVKIRTFKLIDGLIINPMNIIVLLMNETMKYMILELKFFSIIIILINDIVEISNVIHINNLLFNIKLIPTIIVMMVTWRLSLFVNLIKLYLYILM